MVEFREIKGFEGLYEAGSDGTVKSLVRNKLLKPSIDRYGYYKVVLSKDGKRSYCTIHRIIAQVFIKNPLNKPTVNHINEIKTDNRVENLQWTTVYENVNHGTRNKRMSNTKSRNPVIQTLSDGTEIEHKGVKSAGRSIGKYHSAIANTCKGFQNKAYGFEWRYKNAEY